MATTTETVIIKVTLDDEVIQKSRQRATELRKEIKELSDQQKAATKSGQDLTKEFTDRAGKLKALQQEERTHLNVLKQANILTNAKTSSDHALAAQSVIRTQQLRALTQAEREGTEEGRKLVAEVKALNDAMIENGKSVSDGRRNVGNYEQAIRKVIDEGGNLNFVLRDMQRELQRMSVEGKEGSEEFNNLAKRAGELREQIKDANEAGKEFASGSKFGQIGNQFKGIGNDLKEMDFDGAAEKAKRLATVAKTLTFAEMIGGVKSLITTFVNLGKALITNPLFLVASALAVVGVAIYNVVQRNKEFAASQIKVNDLIAEARKESSQYAEQLREADKNLKLSLGTISEVEAQRQDIEAKFNKQREDRLTKHYDTIKEIAKELNVNLEAFDGERINIRTAGDLKELSNIMQFNKAVKELNDAKNTDLNNAALAQAKETSKIVVDANNAASEEQKQKNQEDLDKAKEQSDKLLAEEKERLENVRKEREAWSEAESKLNNEQLQKSKAIRDEFAQATRDQFAQERLDLSLRVQAYTEAGVKIEEVEQFKADELQRIALEEKTFMLAQAEERINKEAELAKNQAVTEIEDATLRAATIAKIERERLAGLAQLYDPELNGATAGAEATIILDEETKQFLLEKNAAYQAQLVEHDRATQETIRTEDAKTTKQKEANFKAVADIAANVQGVITELTGESSEAAKAAAIVASTISIIQGAIQAYNSAQVYPPPLGPILGASNAALVTAAGLAKLAKIKGMESGGEIESGNELPGFPKDGDNTLILAKPGEVVLNQRQQSILGLTPFSLAKMGVPGFAMGGVVDGGFSTRAMSAPIQQAERIEVPTPVLILQDFEYKSGTKVSVSSNRRI